MSLITDTLKKVVFFRSAWKLIPLAALLLIAVVVLLSWIRIFWVERLSPEQAAPNQGRWIQAHDVKLYVQEFGDLQAPVLLMIHGTGAWAGTWDQNVQAMADAGYRVVALDLPPFGFSTQPVLRDYSRATQARRIAALIESLNCGPVTLLGHSYGGGPASEAAMLYPQLVRHLILVDAAVGLKTVRPESTDRSLLLKFLDIRFLRTTFIATLGTQPVLSSYWLSQFVAKKEVVTTERTAVYQIPFTRENFSASLGDWAVQFAAEQGKFASESALGFQKLAMPLTLVWGSLDTITPPEQAKEIAALVPKVQLLMLDGVGHIPQIENPKLFNQTLVALLTSIRP